MFMGNDEIKNTLSLTKIKFRSTSTYMLRAIAIIIFIFLAVLLPNVITTLKYHATAIDIKIYDYSFYSFIGITIAIIIMCIRYKQMNDYFSVFPQTNTGRFLSSQIILYLWVVLASIISVVLYLMQFLVFKILSILNSNIILAFKTDPGFILMGILVYFMYALLMVAFFSLIAAFIRKFNTVAVVFLLVIAAILLTSELGFNDAISNTLRFLTHETSIGIFFIKGLITWLLLFIVSIIVNKYTLYYKTQRKYKNSIVAAIGIVALIVVSIIRSSISTINEPIMTYKSNGVFYEEEVWKDHTITLDASEYEDLSEISVVTNIKTSDNMYLDSNYVILPNFGKKIVIQYKFPVKLTNNYDLIKVINPKLTAILKDNELNITYSYDKNIKVLFISPWYMMRQFDKYQNKGLYSDMPDFNTTNSNSSGHIYISVE